MSKILITAGLGDFIAIETWLTEEEKEAVDTILWATRAECVIKQSIDLNLIFPNLKHQITLHENWCSSEEWEGDFSNGRPFCIVGKQQLPVIGVNVAQYGITLEEILDYSVTNTLISIDENKTIMGNSTYIQNKLASIDRFDLPVCYIVIHPYSSNALTPDRDISEEEWQVIVNYLELNQLTGVVLGTGKGNVEVPSHALLINLINKTTIAEAIELAKQCYGFIGSASALSVIASKHLVQPNRITVKGHKALKEKIFYLPHGEPRKWDRPMWMFYYTPIEEDSFILQSLENLQRNILERETREHIERGMPEMVAVKQFIEPFPGCTAIDIGANVGEVSFYLAKMEGINKVIAFEPNPEAFTILFSINEPKIFPYPMALSDKDSVGTLYIPYDSFNKTLNHRVSSLCPEWVEIMHKLNPDYISLEQVDERTVTIKTLDCFNFQNVKVIKIDVEGHEFSVLQGAKNTIKTNTPIVVIEVVDDTRIFDVMQELGYTCHFFHPIFEKIIPLTSVEDRLEGVYNYIFVPTKN